VLTDATNLAARAEMQLGACLAGLAIENSMLGAAHALANPLTAAYEIVHGEAIALMLPHVIRRNGQSVEPWYRELIEAADVLELQDSASNAADALATWIAKISREAGLAGTLSERGVPRDAPAKLAAAAAKQWTGTFNPVEFSSHDFQKLYEAAYD
jgi:alcohol dehydrogenase